MSLQVELFKGAIGTPARSFLFNVIIPRLGPNASFRAQTAQIPSEGATDMEVFYHGRPVKFVGTVEYEHTWTATFVESETGEFIRLMSVWRASIYQASTGIHGPPALYKDNIIVQILRSTDGAPWLTGTLMGAYPKAIDALELDRSANTETVKWSIQFNFDSWLRSWV